MARCIPMWRRPPDWMTSTIGSIFWLACAGRGILASCRNRPRLPKFAVLRGSRRSINASYHLLRAWHGLPAEPYLGQTLAYIQDDPNLAYV